MCGIAGFFLKESSAPSILIENMAQSMWRRGPDAQGFWGEEASSRVHRWNKQGEASRSLRVALGHKRLSILDLSENGNQPMATSDGRFVLTFGGEIYNYVELKEVLPEIEWKTRTDTEVLLQLWAKHGAKALKLLNGMFSFAVYDRQLKEMWLVRDPLGVKPLYYFQDERGIFFASEIRALLKARVGAPSLKLSLLRRYLCSNWIADPDTLFEGIHKLPPGNYLKILAGGKIVRNRYWEFRSQPEPETDWQGWEQRLDKVLDSAVHRQMRSDVPVSFFLSGGVDSSLLVAKALQLRGNPASTYTVGFKWSHAKEDFLDLESSRLFTKSYRTDSHEIILEPSILSILPKVVEALEEPIADPAAVCSYLLCEAAAKQNKVLVSGQGGDELFGGYGYYLNGQIAAAMTKLPQVVRVALASAMRSLPYQIGGHRIQTVHRIKKLLDCLRLPWPEVVFALRGGIRLSEVNDLLEPHVLALQADTFLPQRKYFRKVEEQDLRQQMMYLDLKTYLPALNLTYTDKTSMWHSVEVRVPYLDQEVVDFSASMPTDLKTTFGASKRLLKAVAKRVLPSAIVERKKTGFGLPLRDWFLGELDPLTSEYLGESRLRKQGLFNPQTVNRWLQEHRKGVADHSFKLYSLMNLQLWAEHFKLSV